CRSAETPEPRLGPNTPAGGSRRDRARSLHRIFAARRQHHGDPRSTGRRAMQQKPFALSLGFAAAIRATHHAFAASSGRPPPTALVLAPVILTTHHPFPASFGA